MAVSRDVCGGRYVEPEFIILASTVRTGRKLRGKVGNKQRMSNRKGRMGRMLV